MVAGLRILVGDCRRSLRSLPEESMDTVVTSPPPSEVWELTHGRGFAGSHFAVFPPELVERCLSAGCPPAGTVLDPFAGAGTTGVVALRTGGSAVLCELNAEYAALARERIESGGRLDSDLRCQRREGARQAELEAQGQGVLL